MVESLKTLWIAQYICIKDAHSWRVYSTETNSWSPIPNFISSPYIAECGLSESYTQAHNWKIWTVASDLPWTPSHVWMPIKPLYSHSARRRMERNWGSHHWNTSLRATDSLVNDDCKSLSLAVQRGTCANQYSNLNEGVQTFIHFVPSCNNLNKYQ